MKILFLNDSALLTHGLASGFTEHDEIRYVPVHVENWPEKLQQLCQIWHPDFALAEGVSISTTAAKLFPLLRGYRIPLVYWAIDDPPDWKRMSLPLARGAALVLTPAEEYVARYRQHGIRATYFHFGCNPAFHRYHPEANYAGGDIVLVANYYTSYPQRQVGLEILLTPLLSTPYRVKVFGNEHWLHNTDHYTLPADIYAGYLAYADLPLVYSATPIVLGLHSVIDSPTMMSMRTFEALGCRAFYLTQWTPAVESLFKNHVHLVWTRHPDETRELVHFYLARPELRQKIAQQGQAEVYRHHTYRHRIDSVRPQLERLR